MKNNCINYNNSFSFNYYINIAQALCTGDGTVYGPINFDAKQFDLDSNVTVGVFQAPRSGYYLFKTNLLLDTIDVSHTSSLLEIYSITGATSIASYVYGPGACFSSDLTLSQSITTLYGCALNEQIGIRLQVSGGTKVIGLSAGLNNSYFCGNLINY